VSFLFFMFWKFWNSTVRRFYWRPYGIMGEKWRMRRMRRFSADLVVSAIFIQAKRREMRFGLCFLCLVFGVLLVLCVLLCSVCL